MFVGRSQEIERLEQALIQTRSGEPAHFMITGERGIGKTSLLLYLKYVATGQIPYNSVNFRFLTLDLDLDPNTTQLGLIRRIKMHLDHQLGKTESARTFLGNAWAFLQRIRIMDSGLEKFEKDSSEELLLDEFALTLAQVCERTCDQQAPSLFSAQYDGILLVIDEADNCSNQLHLGSFLKLLIERLQRHGCTRVLVALAGLPELRTRLHTSHPSSLRIFEDLQLGRLTNQEVANVITLCLERANRDNEEKTTITDEARKVLVNLSEGYPHFIQQFGYSAFASDKDFLIDQTDVQASAFGQRGALDLIGDRYYRNDFYNKIQQDSYRQVLRIMADDLDGWVSRSAIASSSKGNHQHSTTRSRRSETGTLSCRRKVRRASIDCSTRALPFGLNSSLTPTFSERLLLQHRVPQNRRNLAQPRGRVYPEPAARLQGPLTPNVGREMI